MKEKDRSSLTRRRIERTGRWGMDSW